MKAKRWSSSKYQRKVVLPPLPEEMQAFFNKNDPKKFERKV
jgi:hypothetical protein